MVTVSPAEPIRIAKREQLYLSKILRRGVFGCLRVPFAKVPEPSRSISANQARTSNEDGLAIFFLAGRRFSIVYQYRPFRVIGVADGRLAIWK